MLGMLSLTNIKPLLKINSNKTKQIEILMFMSKYKPVYMRKCSLVFLLQCTQWDEAPEPTNSTKIAAGRKYLFAQNPNLLNCH